jgi:tetratricopeptide (TPR) repeat protein
VRAAVDLLVESARLPFAADVRRELRLTAARLAAAELGDRAAAIDVYRGVLADDASDAEAIERLGALLEEEGRTAELLGLRQLQLGLERDPARRLAIRLDLARLVGVVEEKGGRLEALQANLADVPGHEPSIDALSALYAGKGQHKALAELLEDQASKLEAAGDGARAARLWARAAATAEHETREVERAIAALKRVVNLAPSADAYRALARLQLGRGQPAQAVPWFESLLATLGGRERLGVVHQLARAHLAAGHPDRAISAIEANLDDKEPATELRLLLAELYREGQHWEPLARHLTRSLAMFVEDGRSGALAREAAAIYAEKLDQPAKAIPALERALALDPTDRKLRAHLAAGLRTAGQLDLARAQLHELIEGFGRRRSPERAVLHVELAKVARAEGKLDEALAEMDAASKMDQSNARIQRELAELAREAGQLDTSERTYRSLLLVVRRQPPGEDEQAVGQSEVLYELAALARARSQEDQAKELLESAIDAAIQSDAEVRRLRRSLLAHGEADTLLRVLQLRLARSTDGASQARLLGDMAAALDDQLGRPAEALDAMLRAVQAAPDRLELHDRARALAKKTGDTPRYVDTVEIVVERLRRKDDPPLVAALLLRAGEALEHDAGDRKAASSMYRRVEALGVRLADAYSAQARVAGALGDTDQQARALDNMLKLAAAEGEGGAAQVDALYRLAEIFVGTPARRTQGVELIERALASEPRWVQAGRILRAAAAAEPGSARVMQLYDRVARNSGDAELRLDYLERRSLQPGVTAAQVREAVELAFDSGQDARGEVLLARAIEQARTSAEGATGAVWAMLQLADRRIAAGELVGARELIYDAIGSAEPRHIDPLIGRLARKAATSPDHHGLAADMFELLRERAPGDRTIWEPLLELYRAMGDGDRVTSLISMTLPHIADAGERGSLRRGHAQYLASIGRAHDATDILRDALVDNPDDLEAAALLEANLRALDDAEGLADFLRGRFDDAVRRRNPASALDVAGRLGALLEGQGESAAAVYRAALAVAPDDRDLLRRVVAGLTTDDDPAEAAALMERLLAVESPERAPALAGHLASVYEQAQDWDGVQRTLELAHRAAPDDVAIHDRLDSFYRDRGLWTPLATLMMTDAARTADHAIAVGRLRDAAGVFLEQLDSPIEAARALALARVRRPDSANLVAEQAAALIRAGDTGGAIAAIGEAIDGPTPAIAERGRLELLMQRAALRASIEDDDGTVADLDVAYELDPGRSSPALADALERMRNRALAEGDLDRERTATLRLATLLTELGDPERARDLLVTWIERAPTDPDPLYLLRDMDAAIEHWGGVIAACTRLAYIVESEPQVQAALDIASASAQAGRPAEAIPVLEMVHQAQPAATALRDKLRELYAQAGAHRELAAVLMVDAEHAGDVPSRFELYRRAAELLLYSAGDPAAAAAPAGRASALMPDDHAAAMLHVDVLIASAQTEAAAQVLDAAIAAQKKRSPELATMQQRMGRVQGMLGDREGHLAWLKKAFDVDRKSGEIAAELAQLATEIGDYELALKPLRAISLMENPQPVTRPMALLWEAKIEHARGNRAKAELWAKKALREDPEFTDAQQFLDELGA